MYLWSFLLPVFRNCEHSFQKGSYMHKEKYCILYYSIHYSLPLVRDVCTEFANSCSSQGIHSIEGLRQIFQEIRNIRHTRTTRGGPQVRGQQAGKWVVCQNREQFIVSPDPTLVCQGLQCYHDKTEKLMWQSSVKWQRSHIPGIHCYQIGAIVLLSL